MGEYKTNATVLGMFCLPLASSKPATGSAPLSHNKKRKNVFPDPHLFMSASSQPEKLNLAPGSFPSAGARVPLAAPPTEQPPFVHTSLSRVEKNSTTTSGWIATAQIPAGTVLIRERSLAVSNSIDDAPIEVAAAEHGGAVRACLWFGADVSEARTRVIAVLPRLAAVAHSSAPNATLAMPIRWVPHEGTILTLLALTSISAGEQVTAARVEILQSPSRRAAQLLAMRVKESDDERDVLAVAALDARLTAAPGVPTDVASRATAIKAMKTTFEALGSVTGDVRSAVDAWLCGEAAAAGLGVGHWRVIEARVRATCAAAAVAEWPDAWQRLALLTLAVAACGVHRSHADALRLTMELSGVIVRGWQKDDPAAALEATAGGLLARTPERRAETEWLVDTLEAGKAAQPFVSGTQ